jgi:SPP1 family predicted phage head-tail adaptor
MSTPIRDLRHSAVLSQPVETPDDIGGFVTTFTPVGSVRIALKLLEASSAVVDDRQGQSLRFQIDLRWRSDMKASWRLGIGGRVLQVLTVADPDGRKRFLRCLVEEVLP